VAEVAPAVEKAAAHTTEEAAAVRGALKGAPNVRSAQAGDFSAQRRARFAKTDSIFRDTSIPVNERQAYGMSALKGSLDRPISGLVMDSRRVDLVVLRTVENSKYVGDYSHDGGDTQRPSQQLPNRRLHRGADAHTPLCPRAFRWHPAYSRPVAGGPRMTSRRRANRRTGLCKRGDAGAVRVTQVETTDERIGKENEPWLCSVEFGVVVLLTASMSLVGDDYHYLWLGLALLGGTAACAELSTVPYNAMLRQLSTPQTSGRISGCNSKYFSRARRMASKCAS
jgi:hypothetical protein